MILLFSKYVLTLLSVGVLYTLPEQIKSHVPVSATIPRTAQHFVLYTTIAMQREIKHFIAITVLFFRDD